MAKLAGELAEDRAGDIGISRRQRAGDEGAGALLGGQRHLAGERADVELEVLGVVRELQLQGFDRHGVFPGASFGSHCFEIKNILAEAKPSARTWCPSRRGT
jgi:hypothetical protein